MNLIYKDLYPKALCLIAALNDRTFYIENTKTSQSIMIETNSSYIIPDYIQDHLECSLLQDFKFYKDLTIYKGDDIRYEEFNRYEPKNIFEKYVCLERLNNNRSIEKLISINKKLKALDENDKKYLYVDGSVILSGTVNIAGLSGINIYDENHNFIDEIYINIENWISPLKAESIAFFIVLLIAYDVNNVYIMTDSELVFNRFNEIIKQNYLDNV